jgi:hypothetical protein
MYHQIGGGKCRLCGSDKTNITTCPLNPDAKKPNPDKQRKKQQLEEQRKMQ